MKQDQLTPCAPNVCNVQYSARTAVGVLIVRRYRLEVPHFNQFLETVRVSPSRVVVRMAELVGYNELVTSPQLGSIAQDGTEKRSSTAKGDESRVHQGCGRSTVTLV